MDFVKLGEPYTTQYMPTDLIEGYNSLIWTERFLDHGEFELKTFDISMKDTLAEGTFVSHLETQETMIVETHEINEVGEGADAQPELTIRGRSATSILEHRYIESKYQKKRRMRRKYSATAAAGVLIYNAINNNSGADLTRGDTDPDTEGVQNHYDWNTKDDLPNVCVTEVVATEGENRWWHLEQGMLYPQLTDILFDEDLGLRVYRPVLPNSIKVFTVKASPLADRGDPVRTLTNDITQLRFELYSGRDRSTGENAVQFSLLQGHILAPTYLESTTLHKTALEVMSGDVSVKDIYRSGDGPLTGWKRKVMAYDGGSAEIPDPPVKPDEPGKNSTKAEREQYREDIDTWKVKMGKWRNKRANLIEEFRESTERKALRELKKARKIDMFAGDISDLSPYRYKTHYDLGDTVMLYGDYGKSAKMVVSEYVRTEDASGDRGFPGLVAP